jgi:hypothetical protein
VSAGPDREYRARIADALLDASPAAHPPGLDPRAARRFRIHRNNVHRALRDALADAYPAVPARCPWTPGSDGSSRADGRSAGRRVAASVA